MYNIPQSRMENVKIVGICLTTCMLYGVLHDMLTAHLCVEYFTREHPTLIGTENPAVIALVWGVALT